MGLPGAWPNTFIFKQVLLVPSLSHALYSTISPFSNLLLSFPLPHPINFTLTPPSSLKWPPPLLYICSSPSPTLTSSILTLHIANAFLSDPWGCDPERGPGPHDSPVAFQRPGAGRGGVLLVQWLTFTHLLTVTLRPQGKKIRECLSPLEPEMGVLGWSWGLMGFLACVGLALPGA